MSNIAGKSYAMNVITPIKKWHVCINRMVFWLAGTPLLRWKLKGLLTLSLIHYARWVIFSPSQFPRLSDTQPKENLNYSYMLFFSNFNGSWKQYVDSFHMTIPGGLNLLWCRNVKYPKSVPLQPFHQYILHNQLWTEHYYNAYPLAASNDVKAAVILKPALLAFINESKNATPEQFKLQYDAFVYAMQAHISKMGPSPVVSMANEGMQESIRLMGNNLQKEGSNNG